MMNTIKTVRLNDMGQQITEFHHTDDFDALVKFMTVEYPNSLIEVRFTK
jgi:hypothetical protein